MELSDLRTFEAVARLGGMNRAAAELNTVQSNVTSRIRALERELGTELFRRHSRGVELTRAGARLLPFASKAAWVLAEARRAVLDDGFPSGRLDLGSLETTAALRLSPVIAAFTAAHPAVAVNLRVGSNEVLIGQVLEHSLDAAFVCGPVDHPELEAEVVFEEELVLARSAYADLDAPALADGARIIVKSPGCAYRDRFEAVLGAAGVREHAVLEFGTLDAIIGCVKAGLGVTMLPRSVLVAAEAAGDVVLEPLGGELAAVETLLVRRRGATGFSALREFLSYLRPVADGDGCGIAA
ncbi:LysR substrate-binding domain-containing protein [Sphingomonas corticis]|uniref:LysR family transcriptional regulator n=1 Tax=Sphingomonas corticis TaxID=2722791 RepID=A0ABX1CV64_9SPHN|nr:LysR substrate-binding domain-containing protein [Sphingomonas corticis]NJR80302.1 LysR family transcriptional regulator [Sphingomonas corticis]